MSHLGARFIVVIGVFLQSPIGQIGPPPSKSLSIEPCRALTFDVNAPPSMLHVRGDFGLLSDHEMNDRARPGRSEYCRIPTVGLTIGEPCERRQQNERYGANCRAAAGMWGKNREHFMYKLRIKHVSVFPWNRIVETSVAGKSSS